MYVQQLHLQGFKTFANRTFFSFGRGITAIVGPNGSGKSNLADALRWVLGEQSYSTLRGRRTEDVIFSGSSTRPPAGMAEVTLVLDNEDGALPLDFPEVEITRRAYRSGANEYFLNRRRVRLQDIEEVLGGLSASYVVIHQGLVDEALSLRPRERRLLLEEAAEVRRHHERRQQALERLRETAANMTRLSDLRSELLPRLRALERQSQQARQRAELEASLQEALRAWYRLLWEEVSSALRQAEREEEEAQSRLEFLRTLAEEVNRQVASLRQAVRESRQKEEERRRKEGEMRRRIGILREQLARALGESRALERHREELKTEIARYRRELASQEERWRLLAQAGNLRERVLKAQAGLQERQAQHRRAETDLRSAQENLQSLQEEGRLLADRLQEWVRRLEQLQIREEVLGGEEAERGRLLEELAEQKRRLEEERNRTREELVRWEETWASLCARQKALQAELEGWQEDLRKQEEALESARLRLADLRARLETLEEEEDALPFLEEWARRQGRPAFSALLDRLTVPRRLQKALAAALGAHIRPLLFPMWEEAREALRALAGAEAGRVTFLPQDELRPPPSTLSGTPALGCEGLLLDHLTCLREDRPALSCLLGRVLLARDLEAARRIARGLPTGWLVVTREGEAVTAEGVLAGGNVREDALERRKERRRLARALAETEAQVLAKERDLGKSREHLAAVRAALAALMTEMEEKRLAREEGDRRLLDLDLGLKRLEEEAGRHRRRLEELSGERSRMEEERKTLQAAAQGEESRRPALLRELEQAQLREKQAREEYLRTLRLLEEARLLWAVARKEAENQHVLEEMAQQGVRRLQKQVLEGEKRLGDMAHRLEAQAAQIASWQAELAGLEQEMAVLEEVSASPALRELEEKEAEDARLREEVLAWEAATARAALAVQRWQDARRELLQRALGEIGPEASAYGPAGEALLNALLSSPPEWTRLPLDPNLTREELERRVAYLREEVRRIGPVNPLAEEEYREARERYDFLGQQLQDLHDAARSLEQVVAELDRAMEQRFHETFEAVQREFQAYFTRLFGGGSAALRLVRLEEEDGGLSGVGVEITARPPGKRVHSLALLSGGERALTSAALLFAILKVNPRPFCLLDEVDAMLDEANVGRFRECLLELASRTQFILITHNRGTIEAADLLYGVSMADDGTSRVLSLRLEEREGTGAFGV